MAKLESLGLVERRGNAADRRVREAVVTSKGKAMTERVDAARETIGRAILESTKLCGVLVAGEPKAG